jgi:hypothetical protein
LLRQQDATLTRLAGRLAPKRTAAVESGEAAKPQAAPIAADAKSGAWVKNTAIVVAVVVALVLAYLAGSTQSTPNGTPAPMSTQTGAEASE